MRKQSFRVADVFSDHMVLQREKEILIWGSGENGIEICVELAGYVRSCIADGGRWIVRLPPFTAGGPYEMTIKSSTEVLTLKDVLVGEVWLAGGQSNMEMRLDECNDGVYALESDGSVCIRYYNVPKRAYETNDSYEVASEKGWRICDNAAFGDISGAAFYYAKEIFQALQIPIGIIGCYWGGTSIVCWMSEESLRKTQEGQYYLKEYDDAIEKQTDADYDVQMKEYNQRYQNWFRQIETIRGNNPQIKAIELHEIVGSCPWPQPIGRKSPFRPAGLFHTMLKRVAPYTIRGFLFYQGEEDVRLAPKYGVLLRSLIELWRTIWHDEELFFLNVQLPNYIEHGAIDDRQWAFQREQQYQVHKTTKNSGLAVLIDSGEYNNIHPGDKVIVGHRLALQALRRCYERMIVYDAPTYAKHDIIDNKIVICFDNADDGLVVRGDQITCFELAGEDEIFHESSAVLTEGNQVCLISNQVPLPRHVRYAWYNYCKVTLFSTAGLPVTPFNV